MSDCQGEKNYEGGRFDYRAEGVKQLKILNLKFSDKKGAKR